MKVTFKSRTLRRISVEDQTHNTNEKVTASKEFIDAVKEQFPDVRVTEHKEASTGDKAGSGGQATGE